MLALDETPGMMDGRDPEPERQRSEPIRERLRKHADTSAFRERITPPSVPALEAARSNEDMEREGRE